MSGDKKPQRSLEDFVFRFGPVILLISGPVMIATAILTAEAEAVATVLAVFGGSILILGVLLGRIEGQIEIGPKGIKAVLRETRREAETRGLLPGDIDAAVGRAARDFLNPSRRAATEPPGPTKTRSLASAIADRAVDETETRSTYKAEVINALVEIAGAGGFVLKQEQTIGIARVDAVAVRGERSVAIAIGSSEPPFDDYVLRRTFRAVRSRGADALLLIIDDATVEDATVERLEKKTAGDDVMNVVAWSATDDHTSLSQHLERLLE